MGSIYGENIKVSIFGQSHGENIGVVIDGFPAGHKIDFKKLDEFMKRRAPGQSKYTTSRKEADHITFVAGIVDEYTCGAPICALIENTNTRSQDYSNLAKIARPGHADFPSRIKNKGFEDVRGGGHFSGRLTAPMCIAGGIFLQVLERKNIKIEAKIVEIAGEKENFYEEIDRARLEGDSVGGVVECTIKGLEAGLGEPIFNGVENRIAQAIFGIPAVKGIEFGAGFEASRLRGSENNDSFFYDEEGKVKTKTNNSGGILGGLTTGMDVVFRVAFKPTPSISKEQDSIDYEKKENTSLKVQGRHDPCVVIRAVPVVEAVAAMAIIDLIRL